jgi:ribosomal protein S18 acetylase RimI-like enzyme
VSQKHNSDIRIVPISEEHIESFHSCLDSVARERVYLAGVKAPPLESTREFILGNIRDNIPQFVALDGERVVGWCDIRPKRGKDFSHCGILGMGVLKEYRRRGIGTKLLDNAIDAAKDFGMEKIELEVYTSNIPAIKLYEKRGFILEGIKKKARKLDGEYFDLKIMALFM